MGTSVPTYRIDVLADGKKLGSFTYRANVGIDELVDNIRKIPRTAITIVVKVRGQRRRKKSFDFEITDAELWSKVLKFVDEKVSIEVYEISTKEKLITKLKASQIPTE